MKKKKEAGRVFVPYRRTEGQRPPLVVVDVGFSATRRTCGLAAGGHGDPRALSFGEVVNAVVEELAREPKAVLVLEAPLSGRFDGMGNPIRRGAFEDPVNGRGAHGWYHGAGATVALGASRLLSQVAASKELLGRKIPVAEAFLTRADGALGDAAAAELIYQRFHGVAPRHLADAVPLYPGLAGAPAVWVFELNPMPAERSRAET